MTLIVKKNDGYHTSDSYVEEDLTPEESLKIQKSKYRLY